MSAAQAFRRRMVDDTGLDPTPALAELEQRSPPPAPSLPV